MNKTSFKTLNLFFLIFIGLVLSIIAGFRTLENYFDTRMYLEIIHRYNGMFDFEPTVWFIRNINNFLLGGEDQTFFLIYAILGVTIKLIAIRKLSLLPTFSIFAYVCLWFVLQEMTQIRSGVAIAIFLLAIPDILNRNFKMYLFKTLLAISFHYSAALMIFIYFINPYKINKIFFSLLPILGFTFALFPSVGLGILSFIGTILPGDLGAKIIMYISLLEDDNYNKINIFNPFIVSLTFVYYYALYHSEKFKSKYDLIFIKLLGFQIFSFYFLFSIPVMAGRVSQFLAISLVILLPHFILIFKEKFIPSFLIILWLIFYFSSVIIKYTYLI